MLHHDKERRRPRRGDAENDSGYNAMGEEVLSPEWQTVKSWLENHGFHDAARGLDDIKKDWRNNGALASEGLRWAIADLKIVREGLGSPKGDLLYVWE